VVDETCLAGRYDFTFTFEPENLQPTLTAALNRLGLELVEAPREIKLLRLAPAASPK